MLMPHRPGATESIVATMRAANGGGIVKTATEGKNRMRLVTAAKAAVSECFQALVPMPGHSAIAAQLDHSERKIKAISLSRDRDVPVEIVGRAILRTC
jgi:hypothetical protein